jgi:hypothetical protein
MDDLQLWIAREGGREGGREAVKKIEIIILCSASGWVLRPGVGGAKTEISDTADSRHKRNKYTRFLLDSSSTHSSTRARFRGTVSSSD